MVVYTCHHRTEKSEVGREQVGWQPELHTKLDDIKTTMWDSVSEIKIMMIMVMIKNGVDGYDDNETTNFGRNDRAVYLSL